MEMLDNVILLSPELQTPNVSKSVLTDAVLKLADPDAKSQFELLSNAAIALLDLVP